MNNYIVYFEYYSEGEIGNDKYRFTNADDAFDKMRELARAIKANFAESIGCEVLDEPDFFGIIDNATGDFAKVILKAL